MKTRRNKRGNDKLSILLCSYNREELLQRSIESILACRIPKGLDLEVVVVDDRSGPKTWKILKAYSKDPRFVIHRNKKHLGIGGPNWNKAFELSTGNIVTNNEDDMIWDPEYIARLYKELKKHDGKTVVFGMYVQTPGLEAIAPPKTRPRDPHMRIHPLTGMPMRPTNGGLEHVCHNQYFCYRECLEPLAPDIWPTFPVNGIREETDLYLRLGRLDPPRRFVAVPEAVLWHIWAPQGGYRLDPKVYRKWSKINHRSFLKRNFGGRTAYMIPFYHTYLFQKGIRDYLGRKLIDERRKKKAREPIPTGPMAVQRMKKRTVRKHPPGAL